MKKTINYLLMSLFVATLSLGFVACSDDDDDDNNGNPPGQEVGNGGQGTGNNMQTLILGTWIWNDEGDVESYTFNPDGTGVWVSVEAGEEPDTDIFRWSINGNILTMIESDGSAAAYEIVGLQGNTVTLRYQGMTITLTKQG